MGRVSLPLLRMGRALRTAEAPSRLLRAGPTGRTLGILSGSGPFGPGLPPLPDEPADLVEPALLVPEERALQPALREVVDGPLFERDNPLGHRLQVRADPADPLEADVEQVRVERRQVLVPHPLAGHVLPRIEA